MKKSKLFDGTPVYCLRVPEARMLDHHVDGYLQHGIAIKDNDVVFDVGANIGVFALRAIQKGENVKVYCFEPIPEIAATLRKNAEEFGHGNVTVFEHGLSNKPDNVTFTYFPNTPALSTSFPEHWDDNPKAFKLAVKGTMKNPPVGMRWMKLIPPVFSGLIAKQLLKGKRAVQCELKTLSQIIVEHNIPVINLLKIDCEGAEWFVLKGIDDQHWHLIQSMVIEVHDVDGRLANTIALLESKGFDKIVTEREKGLEHTQMYNVFALKS